MITQNLLNDYRRDLEQASTDAKNYLKALSQAYLIVNPSASVTDIRDYTIDAIQDSLYVFGDQAKQIANNFFDTLAQQNKSNAVSQIYDNIELQKIDKKVRYYASSIVKGDNDKFIEDVGDLTSYYVKREAFINMIKNCDKNNIRYARVPSGRETCAFCFMLSSRGFVYATKADAGDKLSGHEFHTHCDCIVVPGFGVGSGINQDNQIEGYKPTEMVKRYKACYDAINPNGTWEEVYEQWKKSDTEDTWKKFKNKALVKEINTRDWGWLWSGKVPAITYETPELEKEIKEKRSHEIETAKRLVKQGVRADFRIDQINNYPKKGLTQGFADFKNGIELKTFFESYTLNTVDDYIRTSEKKSGLKAIVFDNTTSTVSDGKLKEYILKSRNSKGTIYILSNNGYWFVK